MSSIYMKKYLKYKSKYEYLNNLIQMAGSVTVSESKNIADGEGAICQASKNEVELQNKPEETITSLGQFRTSMESYIVTLKTTLEATINGYKRAWGGANTANMNILTKTLKQYGLDITYTDGVAKITAPSTNQLVNEINSDLLSIANSIKDNNRDMDDPTKGITKLESTIKEIAPSSSPLDGPPPDQQKINDATDKIGLFAKIITTRARSINQKACAINDSLKKMKNLA